MKCCELIEYFAEFDPDELVCILIVKLDDRVVHIAKSYQLITDAELPVFLLEIDESHPMDELIEEVENQQEDNKDDK